MIRTKMPDNDEPKIIIPRDIKTVTLKRLQTFDGLIKCVTTAEIGDEFKVDMATVQMRKITFKDGKKTEKLTVTVIDENGEPKGWICAELFYRNGESIVL